jgi:tyrosine-protein kinase Etk/Wzc
LELDDQIRSVSATTEIIDFGKLRAIIRSNLLWIALIFLIINTAAYLFIRYSKNIYQSSSEIKLDIKSEASELGIKTFGDNQSVNLISGEIELIRSKLFLSRVIENGNFSVSFISVGHLLNDELYPNPPAFVNIKNRSHSYYNIPLYFNEINPREFTLKVGKDGQETMGTYGSELVIGNLSLILERNDSFTRGDEVGYYILIQSEDALLSYISSRLIVEPLNFNANIIGISFKDHNPVKARDILNRIDTLYLKYSIEKKNQINKQKIDWLTNELMRIESRMEDFENYFKEFTLENKTNNLDQNLQLTIGRINSIDSQRYDLSRRIKEAERLVSNLQHNNFQVSSTLRNALPRSLDKNIDDILGLAVELEKMKLSYQETTFAFREKQNQLDITRQKSIEQLQDLNIEWQRRLTDLNRQKEVLENDFKKYPDKNTAFIKNQRFYKLYESFYLSLMQSKSEFEIAQAGTTANFQILSPASNPVTPISPNKPMIMGIGLVASLIANFFFVGILYQINNKITNLSELEKVKGAPVIGLIPASKYSSPGLHVIDYPKSMMSEAIRTIRTNLDFFNPTSSQKIIAISSTISGEGKSFVAMNLGAILALSRKRVVLINLDMRKSKTSQPVPNVDNTKGVSTILIRKHSLSDCIVKTEIESFDYIPAGPNPPNPSELLLNGEFSDMINSLKKEYDFIILDTPPVGLVTDGIMAMRKADICLYIFRANYSKKEFINNLKRLILINKFTNITTLLNAVPRGGKPYGYGYYEEPKKASKISSPQHV